ncbi:hypothetical protein Drorol1_Dr00020806 [Drosera rotundifolia]
MANLSNPKPNGVGANKSPAAAANAVDESPQTKKRKSKSPDAGDDGKRAASLTISDPEVLDCVICFEPLTSPVYQCGNGHIACSRCCNELKNKCPSCNLEIGKIRCRALEKVIESVKTTCCYENYGCKDVIAYCHIKEHERTCSSAPFSCLFSECLFRGTMLKLSNHISIQHSSGSVLRFSYNRLFQVDRKWNKSKFGRFIVLQEENDGVLFVIAQESVKVYVTCVEACSGKGNYSYEIIARHANGSVRFQSTTNCVEGQIGCNSSKFLSQYLFWLPLVPNSCGNIELCIWSKSASPPDIRKSI